MRIRLKPDIWSGPMPYSRILRLNIPVPPITVIQTRIDNTRDLQWDPD